MLQLLFVLAMAHAKGGGHASAHVSESVHVSAEEGHATSGTLELGHGSEPSYAETAIGRRYPMIIHHPDGPENLNDEPNLDSTTSRIIRSTIFIFMCGLFAVCLTALIW